MRRVSSHRRKPYIKKLPTKDTRLLAMMQKLQDEQPPEFLARFGPDMTLLRMFEAKIILWVCEQCAWNRSQAATLLGISLRGLRLRLREYSDRGMAVVFPGDNGPMRSVLSEGFWKEVKEWMEAKE